MSSIDHPSGHESRGRDADSSWSKRQWHSFEAAPGWLQVVGWLIGFWFLIPLIISQSNMGKGVRAGVFTGLGLVSLLTGLVVLGSIAEPESTTLAQESAALPPASTVFAAATSEPPAATSSVVVMPTQVALPTATPEPAPTPALPPPTPVAAGACTELTAAAQLRPSTVQITTSTGTGTGMVITADGYILTADHVVERLTSAMVMLPDGRTVKGQVVGHREKQDLALIKVNESGLQPVVLGDDRALQQGQRLLGLGYPGGDFIKGEPTLTGGLFSARRVIEGVAHIQTDAALNPGNSGGPVFTHCGQVVGVVSFRITDAISLNFAVAVEEARPFIAEVTGRALPSPASPGSSAAVSTPGDATLPGAAGPGVPDAQPNVPTATRSPVTNSPAPPAVSPPTARATPRPNATPFPPATPSELPVVPVSRTWIVNTAPVGCHGAPQTAAPIVAIQSIGTVSVMDAVQRRSDGSWHRESGRQCWVRTDPGPVRAFFDAASAERFSLSLRAPQVATATPRTIMPSGTPTLAAPRPPSQPVATPASNGATTSVRLSAPQLVSPIPGALFNHFPRRTVLEWRPVPGAIRYRVEVDISSNGTWELDRTGKSFYGMRETAETRYSFDFVGAQPGRWRVSAVAADGREGATSEWRDFVYSR